MRKVVMLWTLWTLMCGALCGRAGAETVPAAAKTLMPKGAISLQAKSFKVPGGETLVHLYVLPTGHSKERENMTGEKRTGPVKREHIDTGPSVEPSRFWLDVFSRKNGRLQRLNSVPFIQTKDAADIQLRYLMPAKKQGPIVMVHSGFTHWHEWMLFVFPKGFSGPATQQTFYWGGEGEIGVTQKFNRADKNGTLLVDEESTDENGKATKRVYKWDGVEFADPSTPYFVIGASEKTRAAAEAYVAKNKMGFVRPSSHYKNLSRGLWVVVLSRHASLKEANEMVASLRKENKISAYVKRAF
jgi:hypothetical protein